MIRIRFQNHQNHVVDHQKAWFSDKKQENGKWQRNVETKTTKQHLHKSAQRVSKETPEVENFVTIYYEFPGTFTANLMGSRKMLQVGVGVSTQYDESIMEMVESHQLALRSIVLGVLSEFGEEDIKGIAGREKLATTMKDAMNAKLISLEDFGGVAEVHFTSFVLQ